MTFCRAAVTLAVNRAQAGRHTVEEPLLRVELDGRKMVVICWLIGPVVEMGAGVWA
jgi:hypothetical protein